MTEEKGTPSIATLDTKLDGIIERIDRQLTAWFEEFERAPFQMAIKVALVLWLLKLARKHLWH